MFIALIHWMIKTDAESVDKFRDHWQTKNTVDDRSGLIGEFLCESLSSEDYPYINWSLDPDSSGDFRSFITVGIWETETAFQSQVARHFNDNKPVLAFEAYRRRRVVLDPRDWRMGQASLPAHDSPGVK